MAEPHSSIQPRVLTGVKPTGDLHLGNFLGAIKPALAQSKELSSDSYFFIADYHSLNSLPKPDQLKQHTLEIAAAWLALGLNPKKSVFYRQSDVPEIFELAQILNSFTAKGLMNRAHAYKAATDAAEDQTDVDRKINMGLFTYPILMSADILAIRATLVPVGEDQLQHIEIARDIAGKLNHFTKSKVLAIPQPFIQKAGSLIPGIDGRKMSKSYDNGIPLFAIESKLRKAVMRITTDSTDANAPKDAESSLVFQIFKLVATDEQTLALKAQLESGMSWGDAKQALFEELNRLLSEPRQKFNDILSNRSALLKELALGAEQARQTSQKTLQDVKSALGFALTS